MDCPHCQSTQFYTCHSTTNLGYKQYRCRDCKKQYNERTGTPFNFVTHRSEVVIITLYYYYSFKMSLDDVVIVIALRGFHLSHQTIHNWIQLFGIDVGKTLRRRRYKRGGALSRFSIEPINLVLFYLFYAANVINSLNFLILGAIRWRRSPRVLLLIRKNCCISSKAVQKIKAQKKHLNPFMTLYRDFMPR